MLTLKFFHSMVKWRKNLSEWKGLEVDERWVDEPIKVKKGWWITSKIGSKSTWG